MIAAAGRHIRDVEQILGREAEARQRTAGPPGNVGAGTGYETMRGIVQLESLHRE
jgi:hypothetical protein